MSYSFTFRVRYQETDRMGVVYHTNYINWFEWGRTELIRACGYPYERIEEQGLLLPVLEVGAQFKQAARYDECVTVFTKVTACTGVRLEFEYEIRRGEADPEGLLFATGFTKHMWVTKEWKPARLERHLPELHRMLQERF
ncbi:acyl-CoA thioesterase [Paenibacillus chartarius]|uniref:Acyl-CoA thioesterase n=1 Tax=Paenibacillus chartarius TaxID=747481 RepID=A0ABV6DN99_9BACL